MLNHAEIASVSTIVPVAASSTPSQGSIADRVPALSSSAIPSLTGLLAYPDFRDGLEDGPAAYHECLEEDETKPWTEEKLIAFVERNLSGRVYNREKLIAQRLHYEVTPYFYSLGFVVSWIDEIVTTVGIQWES